MAIIVKNVKITPTNNKPVVERSYQIPILASGEVDLGEDYLDLGCQGDHNITKLEFDVSKLNSVDLVGNNNLLANYIPVLVFSGKDKNGDLTNISCTGVNNDTSKTSTFYIPEDVTTMSKDYSIVYTLREIEEGSGNVDIPNVTEGNIKQKEVFEKQLQIASKYHKPVIVHSRDAINDTYNIISKYNVIGSLHCFSSSKEMAERFIKLGFYIGIGGVCTYKNAKEIKEVIKAIDLEYIILETDTPYLSPEPVRKEKNTPCNIPIIASYIASLKDVDLSIVSKVTSANASRLFDFFQKI